MSTTTMTTNRDRLNQYLASTAISKDLAEEIDYLVNDVERDYEYDASEALRDFQDRLEANAETRLAVYKEMRAILIELGFYRVMSDTEIKTTMVSRGTVWSFKSNKQAYKIAGPWSCWIDEESK